MNKVTDQQALKQEGEEQLGKLQIIKSDLYRETATATQTISLIYDKLGIINGTPNPFNDKANPVGTGAEYSEGILGQYERQVYMLTQINSHLTTINEVLYSLV